MALFKSQVLTQASGSVGGLTYSHGKGGMYMRARAVPVNQQTARQLAVRDSLAMYSQMWRNNLTQIQRDGWELYAANVATKNRLGDTIFLSGVNQFIRTNVPRSQAQIEIGGGLSLPSQLDAPTGFDLPTVSPVTATGTAAGLSIAYNATDDWAALADNALLIFMGRPRDATRNYFKGPYRLAAAIDGSAATSPVMIPAADLPFPVAAGQRVKVRYSATVLESDVQKGLSSKFYSDFLVA